MTNEEMIEQLEQAIGLIKQNGKDWLDDRDIPILEACIKSLTAPDKIRSRKMEMNKINFILGFISGQLVAVVYLLAKIAFYLAH